MLFAPSVYGCYNFIRHLTFNLKTIKIFKTSLSIENLFSNRLFAVLLGINLKMACKYLSFNTASTCSSLHYAMYINFKSWFILNLLHYVKVRAYLDLKKTSKECF